MKDFSYSIIGYYSQGTKKSFNDLIIFGGFFKKNSEKNFFRGRLVDDFGESVIIGKFLDRILIFKQKYIGLDSFLKYKFEYDEKNKFWEGKCFFPQRYSGRAFCKIRKSFTFEVSEEERLRRIYDEILRGKKH